MAPQEGVHVHMVDPADPTSAVKVASSPPASSDTGLVVHVASQPNGTVSVSNWPASQPVTGTFWPATQPVSGTFWQATQPVSIATNTPDVIDRSGRILGHVTVDSAPTTAVTGTFWQAIQPVSGTVTANQGTAAAVASAWPVKNTDGTNVAAVKAASTAAVATDPCLVVGLSPNSAIPTGSNVIGALTANQSVNNAQIAGNAIAADSGITSAGTTRVFQAAPIAANILVGHVAQTATTTAATVITIPANRTWVGTITVACDGANTGAVGTVGQALGTITTTGANTVPAAGTVVTCEARWGANVTAGTVGSQGSNSITVPMVVATGASGATLALASTQAGTNSRVAAICSGYLV